MGFDATAREWARQALAFLKDLGPPSQGDLIYRGASGWDRLAAGTAGYALTTGGAGADPAWTPFASGTYTPTLTNTTNITSSTANVTYYQRVGSVVSVFGQVTIQATAAGFVELRMSLPIATDITATTQVGGGIWATTSGKASFGGALGATGTDEFVFRIPSAPDSTSINYSFTAGYRVA